MAEFIIRPDAATVYERALRDAEVEFRRVLAKTNPLPEFDPGSGLYDVPESERPKPMTIRGAAELARAWAINCVEVRAELERDALVVRFARSNGFQRRTARTSFAYSAPLPNERQVRSVFDDLGNQVRC